MQRINQTTRPAMSKEKKKSKSSSSSASAKAKATETSNVVANPKLVAAIKSFDAVRAQAKSYLITIAEIAQNEQCTKAEVVASIMEARGVEKSTAETQYSRYRELFTDPDALEAARDGEVDVKTLRQPKVKQKNPSKKKQDENREKRFAKAVKDIVQCAKEGGQDKATVLNTISAALKNAGVK